MKRTFSLMKSKGHDLKFSELTSCLYGILEIGCSFSHLSSELINLRVFPNIKSLCETRADENERYEIMAIAYQCCKSILGEQREEICKFVDGVSEYLFNFCCKSDLSERLRLIRVKLMDLILVAHCPNLGREDQISMEFIPNPQSWIKLMGGFDNVLKIELAQNFTKYGDKKVELNPIIVQCAARFCYYFHWSDQTNAISEDEPSTSKRVKISTRVDFMMEKIKPALNNFNWKWFIVFSELVYNYKNSVNFEEVVPILMMLSECQQQIDYTKENNNQIQAFTKCCYALIEREKLIKNPLVIKHCKEKWAKVSDEVLRVCAGNTNGATEAHGLLQIIIRHEKYSSTTFIEAVVKLFTSSTVNRNDKTVKTIITLLKSFNLDSFPNGKELSQKILEYAFQKHTMATLKKVITSGNEKSSNAVLSELATCCCLLKTDVINFVKKHHEIIDEKMFEEYWDLKNQTEYTKELEEAKKIIRKKNLNVLVLEDEDFLEVN